MVDTKLFDFKKELKAKLENKKAKIGIVGLGYVGLPLSIAYAQADFNVIGFDIDEDKVNKLNSGKSYIKHISSNIIGKLINNQKLESTIDFTRANEVDALILCVPTPLNKHRAPDLSYIKNTMELLIPFIRKGQILSLESTTYPGTTEEVIQPLIESKGFTIGSDYFLIYSPEREDPGNKNYTTSDIPKVLGGITSNCSEVGIDLYKNIILKVVPVRNTKTAEMTKLLENIHRAVNIGLMNELKPLTEKMGLDIYEVIEAASTKPFGFVPYYPGPGLGGHCIPIDPFYLTWKAKEYEMNTKFIELAGEINTYMPLYVVERLSEALNQKSISIKGSKVLVLGISYKKNIDDMRESPSVKIMQILKNKGALIEYSDPYFEEFPKIRNYDFKLKSIKINSKTLPNFDAVILATDHDDFEYELIYNFSNIIIDTRGKYKSDEKVIRS